MVVVELSIAGDQVPVMVLFEVSGNAAKLSPKQIGFTWVNVGVVLELTVMVIDAVVAHCPVVGVKV